MFTKPMPRSVIPEPSTWVGPAPGRGARSMSREEVRRFLIALGVVALTVAVFLLG